jgi:putative radical SAM enzyme (TIGR03279 family)
MYIYWHKGFFFLATVPLKFGHFLSEYSVAENVISCLYLKNFKSLMIEILAIEKKSIARQLGIKAGAKLISINHKPIHDLLDYRFYNSSEQLEVLIEQDNEQIIYEIEKEYQEDLGLVLADLKMRKCGNKCVFCFVHQNPKGLRKTLYFKDEDYRFSFLYGHYVTLSNTSQQDLNRIVEQRLTPLYISVHATDQELRKYLLGIKFDDQLLEKIQFLSRQGIELNCQIVLCPQLNDGEQLVKTVTDLKQFFPAVRSVAIVPVGLTKHRRNLPPLKPVTLDYCLRLIPRINRMRESLKKELNSSFVYLSDEFYIRTGRELPEADYYEGFYQLENGVGLTRDLLHRLQLELPDLVVRDPAVKLTLVSGKLGASALKKYLIPLLKKLPKLELKLYQITNYFYGSSIVVAGLLVGQDIYRQLRNRKLGDYIILPPRILNHDGLFLDDWTIDQLEKKLERKIFIFPDSFRKLFENIEAEATAATAEQARRIRHSGPSLYVAEHMKSNEHLFEMAVASEIDNQSDDRYL